MLNVVVVGFFVLSAAYLVFLGSWVVWLGNKIGKMIHSDSPLAWQALEDFQCCFRHLNPTHWIRTFRMYRRDA